MVKSYFCGKQYLMEPIALNPGGYTGTYKLVGEEVSLDLINTISWPQTDRQHDWLDRPENFISWALACGLVRKPVAKMLAEKPFTRLKKELKEVIATREAITGVLRPLAFQKQPASDAIDTLNQLIHQAGMYRQLDYKTFRWTWISPETLAEVLYPVIWNAAYVLTDLDYSLLKHCPTCDWLFFDKTKNHRRKWCDMEDCGSRDKALRYYHRSKKD